MEHTTSDLLQRLSESATIAMARKARELKTKASTSSRFRSVN